ncbi:MAG: UxaA family hydrolase [Desulfobacterota bacterium]|nr:UxaA family hydrolase [Thermodesulfobacteriota bacterium]MDW8001299.1 UxaA family hydrolase [Deltaproteobacteria bacterium]
MNVRDNIAVALVSLKAKEKIVIQRGNTEEEIVLLENIPRGHKFAIEDIEKGKEVFKYGEVIGIAAQDIKKGELVHDHNLKGVK